ncbi:polysaccharide pyruvyl transferase family protein [uncultured Brevundimonas sp.]|uniref:polysaccharide pyruvyl transferase family protein n=1 Tax=uncultured Brevundimonas sp. TaxID=213418 RepID=UPI003457A0AD
MNDGNAGDGFIALGTRHWMALTGLASLPILRADDPKVWSYESVIFGGGGNLVPAYSTGMNFIRNAYNRGLKIIVLPHTVHGRESEWVRMADHVTLFCRELVSYSNLLDHGFPHEKIGLDHDMALRISPDLFCLETDSKQTSDKAAYCFRVDAEAHPARHSLLPENRDISFSWNGPLWHNSELCLHSTAALSGYLREFRSVHTDRLHIGILGALLGLDTHLYDGSYYKIKAVYDFSLAGRFKNLSYHRIV